MYRTTMQNSWAPSSLHMAMMNRRYHVFLNSHLNPRLALMCSEGTQIHKWTQMENITLASASMLKWGSSLLSPPTFGMPRPCLALSLLRSGTQLKEHLVIILWHTQTTAYTFTWDVMRLTLMTWISVCPPGKKGCNQQIRHTTLLRFLVCPMTNWWCIHELFSKVNRSKSKQMNMH